MVRLVKSVVLLKCPPLGRVCTHCSPRTFCSVLGCSSSATPQCWINPWWQLKALQLDSDFPYRLKQPGNHNTKNLVFNAYKAQRTASWDESQRHLANTSLAFVSVLFFLPSVSGLKAVNLERCLISISYHRWSSMTDVEIPFLKAGAATLMGSWAQTPRRFWTEVDWCPSEAARPRVRVSFCRMNRLFLAQLFFYTLTASDLRRVQRLRPGNDGGGVLWHLGRGPLQQQHPNLESNRSCS